MRHALICSVLSQWWMTSVTWEPDVSRSMKPSAHAIARQMRMQVISHTNSALAHTAATDMPHCFVAALLAQAGRRRGRRRDTAACSLLIYKVAAPRNEQHVDFFFVPPACEPAALRRPHGQHTARLCPPSTPPCWWLAVSFDPDSGHVQPRDGAVSGWVGEMQREPEMGRARREPRRRQ